MNYNEKLKIAKDALNSGFYDKETIEHIFPELKENKDEIMRSMAIKAVHAPEAQSCIKSWGINPDDVVAWLEKQGSLVKYYEDKLDRCACDNFNKGYKKALEMQNACKERRIKGEV